MRLGTDDVLLRAGVEVGEIVVTKAVAFLDDGDRVTLLNAANGVARYNP